MKKRQNLRSLLTPAHRTAALALGVLLICLPAVGRLRGDSDLLSTFPASAAQVMGFRAVDARFGALRTAQVLIEAPDVLAPAFLRQLQTLTAALQAVPGVANVLSLTNVADAAPDLQHGGVVTDHLVNAILEDDPVAAQALRVKVLSRPQVVGNLVSANARAVQIICTLTGQSDAAQVAIELKRVTLLHVDAGQVGVGGAPFVAAVAKASAQAKLVELLPWMAVVLLLAAFWVLRDGRAVLLWLAVTLAGVITAMAPLGWTATPLTVRTGVLPLLWFCLASGLNMHVLVQLNRAPGRVSNVRVVLLMGAILAGAAVWGDAQQTAAALYAMGGLGLCSVWSLVALPALHSLLPPRHEPRRLVPWSASRVSLLVLLPLLAAAASKLSGLQGSGTMVNVLGRNNTLGRGQAILQQHFGMGDMLLVAVDADLANPQLLARVQELADDIRLLPGVASVMHVGDALRAGNQAMEGLPRLPDSRQKALLLYSLLGDNPAVSQLVTGDAQHAVLYVKVSPGTEIINSVVTRVTELAAAASGGYREAPAADSHAVYNASRRLSVNLQATAVSLGLALPTTRDKLAEFIARIDVGGTPVKMSVLRASIERFLASEECAVPLALNDPRNAALVAQLTAEEPNEATLEGFVAGALGPAGTADVVQDLSMALVGPLHTAWQSAKAEALADDFLLRLGLPRDVPAFTQAVGYALLERDAPMVLLPDAGAPGLIQAAVYGQPILDHLLSRATAKAWWRGVGCSTVTLLCVAVSGAWVVAAAPLCLTLLLYGGMAALHISLDPSTEMLTPMLMAQAVLYSAFYQRQRDGRPMVFHALLLGGCFGVLALFAAPPIQTVAALIAVGTVLSAIVSWVLVTTPTRHAAHSAPSLGFGEHL